LQKDKFTRNKPVPSTCPHCGNKLTPWQQVLLATDRALVCKKCWYRIIFDVYTDTKPKPPNIDKSKNKED
jgi:DNA-directed RNA polymerase subunit RPC12/RpoP